MSKRTIPKRGPVPGLDRLEERTLLSAGAAGPVATPHVALVELGPAFGSQPGSFLAGAHRLAAPAGPSGWFSSGYAEGATQSGALASVGSLATYATPRGAGTLSSPPSISALMVEYAAAPGRHVEVARVLDGMSVGFAGPAGAFAGPAAVDYVSRLAHDIVSFSGAFRSPPPALRGMTDPNVDDHLEMARAMVDTEDPIAQPVARADGSAPALLALRASTTTAEGHDFRSLPSGPAAQGGAAVGQRVGSSGHDLLPSPQHDGHLPWSWVPISEMPELSLEGLSSIAVQAARAAGAAVGLVAPQRTESVAMSPAPATPAPEGVGLIAEVLPFDQGTVAAAIDRFFERFEDPSAADSDQVEPAGLTPPPGVVLIAVAAVELARRRWKRRREERAAFGPRRRNAEGASADESFASCGPWSSRLS